MKKEKIIFTLFVLLLFFNKCANQLPPPGGPKDNEPPTIIEVYPESGTLNFNDDHFEITFSEYIDKFSLLDAIFISPEIKRLEYSWTNTTVTISFDDTLAENTTYTIAIGSGIKDLNNKNPMAEAVNISFSTGDKIDVGSIEGQIYDNDLTGIMVFAYQKTDTFANPLFESAKNVTQIGENGKYRLLGLKNGIYRVFAIKDESGNRLYNIGDDRFGVASEIVNLSDDNNHVENIDFLITREDTISPYISNITMTDKYHLSIEYSEALDSSKISSDNFIVFDSLSNKKYSPKYFYSGNTKKHEYFLVLSDTLEKNDKYFLLAYNIYDKHKNKNIFDSFEFVQNNKPDTLAPTVKNIQTDFKNNSIDYLHPTFNILFNDAVSKDDVSYALILDDIDWEISRITDALYSIKISEELKPKDSFSFDFNYKKIRDAAGNSLDSVQSFTINTISDREFTGLSGTINNPNNVKNVTIQLKNIDSKARSYQIKSLKSNYNFERVLPGKYTVMVFEDRNNDSLYSYGSISPFNLSERFFMQQDTLNLRARWPVGDYVLLLNKNNTSGVVPKSDTLNNNLK